jgi:hypothetical protein
MPAFGTSCQHVAPGTVLQHQLMLRFEPGCAPSARAAGEAVAALRRALRGPVQTSRNMCNHVRQGETRQHQATRSLQQMARGAMMPPSEHQNPRGRIRRGVLLGGIAPPAGNGVGTSASSASAETPAEQQLGRDFRSQFARVVEGVDLRSTAGNCAWVRTPQLTLFVARREGLGSHPQRGSHWNVRAQLAVSF